MQIDKLHFLREPNHLLDNKICYLQPLRLFQNLSNHETKQDRDDLAH